MVTGRLSHYRTSAHPIGPGAVHGGDADKRRRAAAEPLYAVWLTRYDVITLYGHPAASYMLTPPLRICPIRDRAQHRDRQAPGPSEATKHQK